MLFVVKSLDSFVWNYLSKSKFQNNKDKQKKKKIYSDL